MKTMQEFFNEITRCTTQQELNNVLRENYKESKCRNYEEFLNNTIFYMKEQYNKTYRKYMNLKSEEIINWRSTGQ